MLEVKDLSVKYGNLTILDKISFSVQAGEWLMIIGPNGAGKTTITSAVTQGVPYTGAVLFEGADVKMWKPRARARNIGVMSQYHYVDYAFTVEEVVRLGRYAYASGPFSDSRGDDTDMVQRALEQTGMERFARQSVLTLSGGELQRTFLAQLFAQDPKLLLLDEPTNHLDLVYQRQVFGLIQSWIGEKGGAVVSVVHDLSLARRYGTHALLLDQGRIAAIGSIDEVMSPQTLDAVYGMDVHGWMRELYAQWGED